MSQLLQTAVIEAAALRDAALRNAESLLIEKYAGRVKSAIDEILDSDEEEPAPDEEMDLGLSGDSPAGDMGMGGEPDAGGADIAGDLGAEMGSGEPGAEPSISESVPLAATDGQKLCSCPDEEEEIEIDFGELEAQMAQGSDDMSAGDMVDREGMVDGGEMAPEMGALPDEEEEEEPIMEGEEPEAPAEELTEEEELDAILEELQVAAEPVSSGYLGTNKTERAEAGEISLAQLQDEEVKEEIEELKGAISDLQESLSRATKKNEKLQEQNKNFKSLVMKAEGLIKETNAVNSKLMYTNKVLRDTSLNERQKKEFAEVILKADSSEGAKVMYETLLRSAGAGGKKSSNGPQSLVEASMRSPSRSNPFIREKEVKRLDPEVERMQKLAGVKKAQ